MGEFRITDTQKAVLIDVLREGRIELWRRDDNRERRRAADQMVKSGWVSYQGTTWQGRAHVYYITDLGRTVARQLGISPRETQG